MKFLTKINRNYLILFSVILLAMAIAGYFIMHIIIMRGAREKLIVRETLVRQHMLNTGETPNLFPEVEVEKSDTEPVGEPLFREVTLFNPVENENEIYLEYSGKIEIKGSWYTVKLRQSVFENEDLILILALTLFVLLTASVIIPYLISRKMNRTVWADFEHNLHEIEGFRLDSNNKISLAESDTEEFERLNKVIYVLTEKLRSDYYALKEFTENASHEIQTPLSVALMNLEEIIQEDLKEETFQKVTATVSALQRLSALNKDLILLTKIDNRQFEPDTIVSFGNMVRKKVDEYSLFIEAKKINVKILEEQDFMVRMNSHLADIMMGNLLSNAVNHNLTGGKINISISPGYFEICNSGEPNRLTNETIFDRFTRGTPGSFGLGLALVKRICEMHDLDIDYYNGEYHCFAIKPVY
ncbi:MAG: HAMP domain-containing sensor histidine kinase [Bacteroidales bacterium]|jgi:signal transduction histidine kinase|nr:HAMP domain-containing sensor histidine kinase [Bacteroidales bacterium]